MMRKRTSSSQFQDLSDEELLVRMVEQDDNRYAGELFKRYAHLVYGVCAKYVRNKADCRDLTMIVFEKLLAKPSVPDLRSFRSWIFTVSKNESLTFLRNQARKSAQREKWEADEKNAENFMEIDEEWSPNSRTPVEPDIEGALKQLKPEQRRCVELFFLKEKSYKEIVQETGLDLKKVKSHLQNGKRKLRIVLQKLQA